MPRIYTQKINYLSFKLIFVKPGLENNRHRPYTRPLNTIMNKIWKKRLLRVLGVVIVLVIVIVSINPLPKFIRYQINKSVTDLEIPSIEIKNVQDLKEIGRASCRERVFRVV